MALSPTATAAGLSLAGELPITLGASDMKMRDEADPNSSPSGSLGREGKRRHGGPMITPLKASGLGNNHETGTTYPQNKKVSRS